MKKMKLLIPVIYFSFSIICAKIKSVIRKDVQQLAVLLNNANKSTIGGNFVLEVKR